MSDNEFDDIMKAMPSNISKLDNVYMCFKDEHDKWCDSIKNACTEGNAVDCKIAEDVALNHIEPPVDAEGISWIGSEQGFIDRWNIAHENDFWLVYFNGQWCLQDINDNTVYDAVKCHHLSYGNHQFFRDKFRELADAPNADYQDGTVREEVNKLYNLLWEVLA